MYNEIEFRAGTFFDPHAKSEVAPEKLHKYLDAELTLAADSTLELLLPQLYANYPFRVIFEDYPFNEILKEMKKTSLPEEFCEEVKYLRVFAVRPANEPAYTDMDGFVATNEFYRSLEYYPARYWAKKPIRLEDNMKFTLWELLQAVMSSLTFSD